MLFHCFWNSLSCFNLFEIFAKVEKPLNWRYSSRLINIALSFLSYPSVFSQRFVAWITDAWWRLNIAPKNETHTGANHNWVANAVTNLVCKWNQIAVLQTQQEINRCIRKEAKREYYRKDQHLVFSAGWFRHLILLLLFICQLDHEISLYKVDIAANDIWRLVSFFYESRPVPINIQRGSHVLFLKRLASFLKRIIGIIRGWVMSILVRHFKLNFINDESF